MHSCSSEYERKDDFPLGILLAELFLVVFVLLDSPDDHSIRSSNVEDPRCNQVSEHK